MAWTIITIYTSKCAQMDPQQLPKTSKFYSRCKKCYIKKAVGGGYHHPPPLVAGRLNPPAVTSDHLLLLHQYTLPVPVPSPPPFLVVVFSPGLCLRSLMTRSERRREIDGWLGCHRWRTATVNGFLTTTTQRHLSTELLAVLVLYKPRTHGQQDGRKDERTHKSNDREERNVGSG